MGVLLDVETARQQNLICVREIGLRPNTPESYGIPNAYLR